MYAVALLASGQSSTITGTYAGQYIMQGFLDLRMKKWLRNLLTRCIAITPSLVVAIIGGSKGAGRLIIIASVPSTLSNFISLDSLASFLSLASLCVFPFLLSLSHHSLDIYPAFLSRIFLSLSLWPYVCCFSVLSLTLRLSTPCN